MTQDEALHIILDKTILEYEYLSPAEQADRRRAFINLLHKHDWDVTRLPYDYYEHQLLPADQEDGM